MTDDKNKPPGNSLVSLPGRALQLIPAIKKLALGNQFPTSLSASGTAATGSVAVAGDNTGSIVNIHVEHLAIEVERRVARELPSYLSRVVAKFSEDLSEYDSGPQRILPPEVDVKLAYNDFPPSHYIIADLTKYINILEASYRGVEQRNDDARRLVRRRAAVEYSNQLQSICTRDGVNHTQTHAHARVNAVPLVLAVVAALLADFAATNATQVMQETAHLAVCLIVADAVIECEVLERPARAATA